MSTVDYMSPRDLEQAARDFNPFNVTVEEMKKLADCIRRCHGVYLDGVMLFFIENRMEKLNGSEETNQ